MSENEFMYSAEVLRNKGIETNFAAVVKDEEDWIKKYDDDGEIKTEPKFIRFSHNVIADIEEEWGGLQTWQEDLEDKPISTLRKTLAKMFNCTPDKVGAMMIEGRLPEYNNAIGVAWSVANGVDPIIAIRLLEQTKIAVDSQIKMINQEMGDLLTELEEGVTEAILGEKQ